jgi:hypothetical protein
LDAGDGTQGLLQAVPLSYSLQPDCCTLRLNLCDKNIILVAALSSFQVDGVTLVTGKECFTLGLFIPQEGANAAEQVLCYFFKSQVASGDTTASILQEEGDIYSGGRN